jgi:hypothetical protein
VVVALVADLGTGAAPVSHPCGGCLAVASSSARPRRFERRQGPRGSQGAA